MIKITQDSTTGIAAGGYVFPVGTVFSGFLNISEQTNTLLTASIDWYVNASSDKVLGLNLPYGLEITVTKEDGSPVYTFNVNYNSDRPFDVALLINTQIVVAYMNATYPKYDGKIEISGIITTFEKSK